MKKRGLSYVDWTVSVGLFIIFTVTIFILLGPAFKQDYSHDYLSSIVKDGIKENTSLEIKRFPVFMRSEAPINGGTHQFTIENLPQEFEGISDKNILIFDNANNLITNKDYEASSKRVRFDSTFANMGIYTDSDIGKIYLLLAEDEIFEDNTPTGSAWPDSNSTFGIFETISGIYLDYFGIFTTNNYTITKEILKYPLEKEFSIEIYNETRLNESPILDYTQKQPTEKDSVNVFLWADWLIYNNAKRTPITVLIKTW